MQFNSWVESIEDDDLYEIMSTEDRVRAKNTSYLPSNSTKYMVHADPRGDVRNPTKPGANYPDVVQQNVTIDGKDYALVYNWYYLRRRFDLIFKDHEGSANYVANYVELSSQAPVKYGAPITDYYHVPEKEGYDFLGWYDVEGNQVTDENGNLLPAYENEIMPAMNTVREAYWRKSGTVTVTFDPNGGSFEDGTAAVKDFEKTKDTLFPTQDIPKLNDRVGYVFDTWIYSDGAEAGKPFDFEHTQLIKDVSLKARWISMASVQVEYDAKDHGTFRDGSEFYDDSAKRWDGTGVILRGAPEKVDEGYYFIGWQMTDSPAIYKAGSAVSIVADSNGKCIFTAVYDKTPIDARLTYHSNYPESTGKENSETTVIKANNSGLNIAAAEDVAFSLKGYTFQGWSELSDGTVKYQPGKEAGIDNRSENDLYAIWAVNRYKLTVDPNGGTWGGTEETTEYIMDYQETKDIEDPTWEGHTFVGWTLTPADSESVLQNRVFTMGVKDTVLTAQWQKVILEADGEVFIGGVKVLEGQDLKAGQFKFVLSDESGNKVLEATNDANGNFEFDAIKYELADLDGETEKVFSYGVTEINDGQSNITYDKTAYTVKVTVTDNGDGTLTAKADKSREEIKFTNKYTPPETPKEDKPKHKKSNNTGDSANGALWALILLLAGGALAGTIWFRRRKKSDRH